MGGSREDVLGVLLAAYMRDEIGGGYFVLARLANYFDGNSFKVAPVVFMNNKNGFVSQFVNESVPWYPLELPKPISSLQRRTLSLTKLMRAGLSFIAFVPSLAMKMVRMCRQHHIRLIHIHSNTPLVVLGPIAKLMGMKLVFHVHDTFLPVEEGGTLDPTTRHVLLFVMRNFVDVIITVSDFVQGSLLRQDMRLAPKITVVHNGVDVMRIRQNNIKRYEGGAPFLMSYGVLAERKGFQTAIRAVSILRREFGIDARYQIIGDGPYRDNLIRLARELQVSDLVEIMAFRKDVHRYVAQADIVLIPPIYEDPLPLVVIESMANSKIIVATKSGGIPEMISDGGEGYLVEKDNPRQIASRIVDIMRDPDHANRVAENAYRRCLRDFTIQRMALQIEEIYRSVLNGATNTTLMRDTGQ